jgi:polyferredoxin
MRKIRRTSQLLFLAVFIFLLTRASYPLNERYPVDLFPRLSPLLGAAASIASRALVTTFWPALVVFILTLLLGRAFCGWVCPMGTTLDIIDKAYPKKKNSPSNEKPSHRKWKYIILAAVLLGSLFGLQIGGWVDPLSLVTRTYAFVFQPYVNFLGERMLDVLYLVPGLDGVLYPAEEFLRKYVLSFQQLIFSGHLLFGIIFAGIAALGMLHRRFWCRSLCPLGAFLALAGRFAPFHRRVSEKCTNCMKCQRLCMTDAIVETGEKTLRGECVYCFTCESVCPEQAISFGFSSKTPQRVSGGLLSRRDFVTMAATGAAAVPIVKLNFQRTSLYPWMIRPPGVNDEDAFLAKCIRCGECMKVCLKNALHPALMEGGLEGLWTPKLVPRAGYCEYNCTLCGNVCPSGAIPKLSLEEKHNVKMGISTFDKNRCIPWAAFLNWNEQKEWTKDYNCAVCEEHCPTPTKAIQFSDVSVQTPEGMRIIRRPVVIEDKCIGCGICEYVCPLNGPAAIRVLSRNATRKNMQPDLLQQ